MNSNEEDGMAARQVEKNELEVFIEKARARLIRNVIREFEIDEWRRERELRLLNKRFGPRPSEGESDDRG